MQGYCSAKEEFLTATRLHLSPLDRVSRAHARQAWRRERQSVSRSRDEEESCQNSNDNGEFHGKTKELGRISHRSTVTQATYTLLEKCRKEVSTANLLVFERNGSWLKTHFASNWLVEVHNAGVVSGCIYILCGFR